MSPSLHVGGGDACTSHVRHVGQATMGYTLPIAFARSLPMSSRNLNCTFNDREHARQYANVESRGALQHGNDARSQSALSSKQIAHENGRLAMHEKGSTTSVKTLQNVMHAMKSGAARGADACSYVSAAVGCPQDTVVRRLCSAGTRGTRYQVAVNRDVGPEARRRVGISGQLWPTPTFLVYTWLICRHARIGYCHVGSTKHSSSERRHWVSCGCVYKSTPTTARGLASPGKVTAGGHAGSYSCRIPYLSTRLLYPLTFWQT